MANNIAQSKGAELNRMTQAAMLFDCYGALLTKKQRDIIEMYFMNDLSLSEISQEFGITRQAVSILIKRTEKNLFDYERKLGLVEKQTKRREKALVLISKITEVCEDVAGGLDETGSIREKLMEVLRGVVNFTGE